MTSDFIGALSSLLASNSPDNHDEILRASDEALREYPGDTSAFHCRVVALLKLDRFDDALRTLEAGGDSLAQRCTLERAYALYKTGQLDEAQAVLSRIGESEESRGPRHVAAQVAYRAEKFNEAEQIYQKLCDSWPALQGEENDLRINRSAIEVQLGWQRKGSTAAERLPKLRREDTEAFETAYNAACSLIAHADFEHANLLLRTARDLCEALDELTDEEKMSEILPIMVQQAYVLLQMGRVGEATSLMEAIQLDHVPEAPTRFILRNNALVASNRAENPYQTHTLLTAVSQLSRNERLFDNQVRILHHNEYVADLHAHKTGGVSRSIDRILRSDVMPTTTAATLDLSTLSAAAKTNSTSEIKSLLRLLDKRPLDLSLILLLTQLHLRSGHLESALEIVQNFTRRLEESNSPEHLDVRFAPGIVAILVSLYRLQGRKLAVQAELDRAARHWQDTPISCDSLKRVAGAALLDSSDTTAQATASRLFKSLLSQDEDDSFAVAGLVASRAVIDFEGALSRSDQVPLATHLIVGVDAATLELDGVVPHMTVTSRSNKMQMHSSGENMQRRRHRPRLPKTFDTSKEVDLERWLPLRDRSSYKPRGKKGKKKVSDTTQGGVVREEESLELVGGQGIAKVEKVTGSAPGNKKKKKVKK